MADLPATGDDEVLMPIRTLETLLCKARSAGWELGSGLVTPERVDTYLHNLVRELVDADVAQALGWLG